VPRSSYPRPRPKARSAVGPEWLREVKHVVVKLLYAAMKLGLEGIVSKRRQQPYRSVPTLGWSK
jgi:hypothetical protein